MSPQARAVSTADARFTRTTLVQNPVNSVLLFLLRINAGSVLSCLNVVNRDLYQVVSDSHQIFIQSIRHL